MLDLFYFFMFGVALLLSALGLWFTALMPGIDRWSKRFFPVYFAVLMACCFFSIIDVALPYVVLHYGPVPVSALYLVLVLESLFLALPMPMLTVYLLRCCGEDTRSSRLLHAVLGPCAVYFLLFVIDPFVEGLFHITPDMRYSRGPLYPLLPLLLAAVMLLNLAGAIQRRKRLSRKAFLSFLAAILPLAAVMPVQIFADVFPLIDISFVLSALSMYGLVLSEQIELELRHQREIADQRASIMVMEMRPHFIYNTMTSVYCLCNQDPERARQVILDFTTYLRKNFTAIASSTPIPFSSELEHTRAYLAVEQAQYQDSLFVDYDIPHTCFRVPPLTLQPIVENAIKHGRDPYAGPFHVSIRTRRTEAGSEIVVADNGRGFSPAGDSEPHIALKNIRQRLEMMCSGHLTVTSRAPGAPGTVVTVTIPDRTG